MATILQHFFASIEKSLKPAKYQVGSKPNPRNKKCNNPILILIPPRGNQGLALLEKIKDDDETDCFRSSVQLHQFFQITIALTVHSFEKQLPQAEVANLTRTISNCTSRKNPVITCKLLAACIASKKCSSSIARVKSHLSLEARVGCLFEKWTLQY